MKKREIYNVSGAKKRDSYSLGLGTLPYSNLGGESCPWQLFYRAETGILKNSVNTSIEYRAERRLKRE